VFGIMSEFVSATDRLNRIHPPSVSSVARAPSRSAYYNLPRRLARLLSMPDFRLFPAGGPASWKQPIKARSTANRPVSD